MKNFIPLLIFLVLGLGLVFSQQEEAFIYDDKDRRDPFIPLVDKNGKYLLVSELSHSLEALQVSGILWDPRGRSSVLINNEIVTIGGFILGYEVEDITKDSVKISKDGKEYTIRISNEEKEE